MRNPNKKLPDVLDCLANLSSDEVFTPPIIVNQMLDLLPQEVFQSTETTFLDPFTKSGVFLREITKRLLKNQIPDYEEMSSKIEVIEKSAVQHAVRTGNLRLDDKNYEEKAKKIGRDAVACDPDSGKIYAFEKDLQNKLNHILTKQVFGIAITELTAHLARRSLYCSKDAAGKYSVCDDNSFGTEGNIRFRPMKHEWKNDSCIWCSASKSMFDRPDEYEQHAYEFIHKETEKIKECYQDMEFTVVCGNPPYQLNDGGGTGSSAIPIFHKFVEQAKRLNSKYLTMIIPARWYAGGKGLDTFRQVMLSDTHIKELVDYTNGADCFPGVTIAGGVCYFLYDRDYQGSCHVVNRNNNGIISEDYRKLDEYDTFIRSNIAIKIVRKVTSLSTSFVSDIVSTRKNFGLESKTSGHSQKNTDDLVLYSLNGKSYISKECVNDKDNLIDKYKVIMTKAMSGGNKPSKNGDYQIISDTIKILSPNEVCTETYLCVGSFDNFENANNLMSYMKTKFFRFLLLQCLSSINISKEKFALIPLLDFSKPWTDDELYKKYSFTQDEIDYIESIIRPME